jgi:alpha-L-fucosidase
VVTLILEKPTWIDHVVVMEDIAQGERIRQYFIEGLVGNTWRELCSGTAVGHKKIDQFDAVQVQQVRLRVIKAAAVPHIRKLAIYNVARNS